jgi:hypothetical protein
VRSAGGLLQRNKLSKMHKDFAREPGGEPYNRHFGCACFHPLFVFNQLGDVERCALPPGNVHGLTVGVRSCSR